MMNVEQSVEWELAGGIEVLERTCPIATLSTTDPTWPDLGSNPGHRGGKPVTNRLSYDTALSHRVTMKMWPPLCSVDRYQCFGGSCCLHLQGRGVNRALALVTLQPVPSGNLYCRGIEPSFGQIKVYSETFAFFCLVSPLRGVSM
jgi:hypothetical protein